MIEILQNRHFGQRAVIVCNGPSLNKMDLSFLKREKTIGLNKIYLGFKKFNFYSNYYVAVNKKVLEQSHREINQLTCQKFLSNRCDNLFKNDCLTHILNTKNPPTRFCKDIAFGLEEGWTVTYAALQVAFYLGFKEIFIIGMDHRFHYNGAPNAESVMTQSDPNHFSPDYFSKGCKWDNPDLENSERSYEIARQVYEQNNRRIFDATVNGNCDIFEKVNYKSVFL
ncbi:DUF115 domain-containing protein [Aliiglaciecola sp. 3_MG-2023]|uniref:6-hydroxymethylpterin diphosphokinase MptE-like protein n=1 Tax=Aliiglaciecola sp. 3_MG-2023 TaxID=3062644 RepID=UPI0026E1F4A6|nr:6-hydroxymethylpterin diphosphokinase MptE-like protein [Aliiglaciecola sp. 3_MG-2023]MDO6691935.1 DUF115 domain-containing protein [Aliiglaciecola sp. 3_MG-2023]